MVYGLSLAVGIFLYLFKFEMHSKRKFSKNRKNAAAEVVKEKKRFCWRIILE